MSDTADSMYDKLKNSKAIGRLISIKKQRNQGAVNAA